MKTPIAVWGLILLVGFWASDYAIKTGYSEQTLWVAWAIIFTVLNYAMGNAMKKIPAEVKTMWMEATVFGLIASLAVASRVVALPFPWLMALWFIIFGAAMFAGGHKMNNISGIMMGIVLLFTAVFVPPTGYFLYGALVFGLFSLISGLIQKA